MKIEEKLNIKLPEDFCEIATFFSGGYLGGISNYSFSNQNLRVYFNYRTAHDKIIESGRPWNWAENYGE
ncbi:hypothetical protein [Bacillus sp. 71mf]|uniref:hypothetical protein n=1 Tax=Bacillus sp. 71mf TaxID=1761757 RepID=UPI0034A53EEF